MKTELALTATILLVCGIVKCTDDKNEKNENPTPPIAHKKPTSYIDLLIDDLLDQEWNIYEKPCYDQILNILTNVKKSTLWATWIWDSNQFPTGQFYGSQYHLGNFDQCLRRVWAQDDPISTQYCLVDITLADAEVNKKLTDVNPHDTAESYFHIKTDYKAKFNILSWGVCLPKVCQAKSVDRFIRMLLRASHLGTINLNPKVMVRDCQATRTPPASSTGLNLILLGAVILIVIACASTIYMKKQRESKPNRIDMDIVSAFDLRKNAKDLISTGKEEIKVMHGIRFLSACIVVLFHVMLAYIMVRPGNSLDGNDHFERFASFFSHLSMVVDTYFMMSGLLLMKSFKPETGRAINPFKIILKRYFRLTWLYIVITLIAITAMPYLHGGPLWYIHAKNDHESCKKNWWLGLLMLGNYIESQNICIGTTWYVPADYHLAVVSTIIYWLYLKNRRGGLYLFGFTTIVSILLPGLYTYLYQLPPKFFFDYEIVENVNKYILGSPIYIQSHLRAAPYFIGLIAGYILSMYKPASYRNVISMKYSILSFITIVALSTAHMILGPAYPFREYNAIKSACFAALNRPFWAVLIAAFIFLCEYGTLPLIPNFLSWSAFVPLSKLSYGIYMCHYFFFIMLTLPLRTPAWYNMMKVIQDLMGVIVISGMLSLYIALFIESPLNNLVAVILKTKSDKPKYVNSEKSAIATITSDSLKENSITSMATLEETGYVSALKNKKLL